MNRTYLKNILRDIKNTKGKVLSIAIMVGLAAAVVVGLTLSGTTMRNTLNNSLKTYGHPDIIVRSTYGLDYEDELILKRDEDIEKYSLVKTADLMENETLIRVKALNKDIPKSNILEGRMPETKDEIALDIVLADKYKLGDKLKFSYIENSRIDDEVMKNMDYTVVGYFHTSDYFLEDMRELSFTAKKELEGYGYVLDENFDTDKFGEANIVYKSTKDMDINSDEYRKLVYGRRDAIEDALSQRPGEVLKAVKEDAEDDLSEAEDEISDARKEISDAEKKLADARKDLDQGYIDYEEGKETYNREITDAKAELENVRIELENGQRDLDNGRAEYQRNLNDFNSRIRNAENEIAANERTLNQGERDLENAQNEVNAGLERLDEEFTGPRSELSAAKAKLDNSKAEIDRNEAQLNELENQIRQITNANPNTGVVPYENGLDVNSVNSPLNQDDLTPPANMPTADELEAMRGKLEAGRKELEAGRSQYEAGLAEYNKNKAALDSRYNEEKAKIDAGQAEINQSRRELDNGWAELNAGRRELENNRTSGRNQLNAALNEINANQASIDRGWADYNEGLRTLEDEERKGQADLKEAYQKLLDGEDEYKENLEKFEKEKADALDEIKEGEADIKKGRDALARLVDPEYDVETIYDNEGIKTYHQNSLNMDELTKVFPTFFYLVAMLVTLTTMKRFIDEQRTINGTLKALGYSNRQISQRFYIYGIIPTTIGAIIGSLLGRYLIAGIIINAYSSGFANIGIEYSNSLPYILFAIILSVGLIALTVHFSSKETVSQRPAALLREKSPNIGKKIWLERIEPLWKKMSFMQKITSRNLFRYKSRMFMTLFGVGGCTALTFFGFAMIDSIKDTVYTQQDEIGHYDVIAMVDDKASDEDMASYKKKIADYSSMDMRYDTFTIVFDDKRREVNVIIPSDTEKLKDFVTLRTPKQVPVNLDQEEAVLTEKASDVLGISIGDTIKFKYENKVFDLPVTNIAENYTGDYLYINKNNLKKLTKLDATMNANYIKGNADGVIKDIEDEKAVIAIINASVIYAAMDVLLANLNLVIGVITLISVMLALVVLYNLININVSERRKELATIKVLGFYANEVTGYIFREIFILTLLGIIVGYGLGYAMFRYILSVVAPDNVMLYYHVNPRPFIYSGLITIAISLVLLVVVHRKLKQIDMAEAMSSGE